MALLLLLLAVRRLRGWDFTAGKRPTCSGIPPGLPEHQPGPCSGEDLTPREFPDDPGSCSASEKTGRARVLGDEEKEAASHLESREGHRGGGGGGRGLRFSSFPRKAEGLGKGGPRFPTSSKTGSERRLPGAAPAWAFLGRPPGLYVASTNAPLIVILLFCHGGVTHSCTDYAPHSTKSCVA